eukprot:jgi/Mesvir1/4034/Mv25940-RA.1
MCSPSRHDCTQKYVPKTSLLVNVRLPDRRTDDGLRPDEEFARAYCNCSCLWDLVGGN